MNIAIITARGNSKRIPRKNIRPFCGRPIIEYSIMAALDSRLFDEVMVSTDDRAIAEIAVLCGAKIPFYRSSATADDYATTAEVLTEVLDGYGQQNRFFENVCCIYPTAPLITANKLRDAFTVFTNSKADALIPVVPFSFSPLRGCFVDESGLLQLKWPEYAFSRSQDLPPMYHDSGQFYMFQVSAFTSQKTLFMENTVPFVLSELEVQDIDNETDWEMAELKYRLLNNK